MLTKEQVQQARQELGLNAIPTSSSGTSEYEKRKKRLEAIKTVEQPKEVIETKPVQTNYLSTLGSVLKGSVSSFGSTVARNFLGGPVGQIQKNFDTLGSKNNMPQSNVRLLYDLYKRGRDNSLTRTVDKVFPGQGKINTLGGMTIDTQYSKDPKEKALQLSEDVINALPGGLGMKALGSIKNPVLRAGATLGVRSLEGGAIASSASGIGTLKEGGAAGDAFQSAKEAFGPGMVLGAGASVLGSGASKLGAMNNERLFEKAKKNYAKATDVNAKQVLVFKDKVGKPLSEFLIEEQLPLEAMKGVQGTKINATKATDIIKKEKIPSLAQQKILILETRPQADYYFDDLSRKAKAEFDKPAYRSIYTAEERKAMKAKVDSALRAEAEDLGSNAMDSLTADRMKTTFASRPYSMADPLRSPSNKAISDVLRNEIETKFKGNPGENIIREVNQKMSHFYAALDALGTKKSGGLHGKVVRGGLLGSKINQIIGAVAGSKIPVVGPMVGAKLGEKFSDFVRNPTRLTQEALDIMRQRGEVPAYLKTVEDAKKYLYEQMLKSNGQLALPQAGESTSKASIQLRGETQFEKPAQKIGNQNSAILQGDNEFYGVQNKLDAENFKKNNVKKVKQEISYDFIGQKENDYQKFVETVKNPKYLNPKIKESIQSGDVETFKNLLKNDVGDIFGGHEGLSDDELFDQFRERLLKENPNILGGKKLLPNFKQDLFGGAAGVEVSTDEQGKPKASFSTEKALAGIGLMAGISKAGGFKLGKLTPKTLDTVSKNLNKEDMTLLQGFIDNVKLKKKVPNSFGTKIKLETEARHFIENIGGNPDQTNGAIADLFNDILFRTSKHDALIKEAMKEPGLRTLKNLYHNCLDVANKVKEKAGLSVEKGIYVKGAKTKEEAEKVALQMYNMSPTKRLGGSTHAWNTKDGQVFDYHLQEGKVNDNFAYISEDRIKELGKVGSDPLIQEAKKYKSAGEFVRAQPIVYHGTANKK